MRAVVWAWGSAGRAPAFQQAGQNDTSAASKVAYAENTRHNQALELDGRCMERLHHVAGKQLRRVCDVTSHRRAIQELKEWITRLLGSSVRRSSLTGRRCFTLRPPLVQ